jgi:hypothetical protein
VFLCFLFATPHLPVRCEDSFAWSHLILRRFLRRFTAKQLYSDFTSKPRPCGFDVSAAAGAWSRLASLNASHFGAASCRGFQIKLL